ncbi:uncharacterized protein LOC131428874 [Malaya genurostris]|uniref:uncharacterized protein LOC131428874 n=1 Tax=Malaya genurostris TaxID=325434 RepID=UPI0026F39655|nr:uncharacterized protein LOC131428874 [Malaya genurostris]
MSAANYKVAWDLLQKRFENKKLIVKAHLDALFIDEPLKRDGYDGLNHLLSEYDRNLQMLDKIGENTYNWSTMLVYMVCSRLDSATLRQWESHHCSKEVPTYDELVGFLRNHCAVLQSIAPNKPPQTEIKKSRFTPVHTHTSTEVIRCSFCEESPHSAFKCQKFIKVKVPERYEKVKRCGLCLNCLSPSHLVRFCNKGFCRHCKQKHHSLLHNGAIINGSNGHTPQNNVSATSSQSRPPAANTSQVQPQPQNQTTQSHNTTPVTNSLPIAHTDMQSHSHQSFITNHTPSNHINSLTTNSYSSLNQVLLSTAVVVDRYGNIQLARALLDSCLEYCFITTNLYKKTYLPESVSYLSVSGIGGSIVKSLKMVEATIAPRSSHISNYLATVKLHVLPKLTSSLPFHPVDIQQLAIPNNIILADPKFNEPGPIDVMLGAEYYYDLLTDGRLKLSEGGPTLQQTAFESCNNNSTYSVEESTCEEIFNRTTVRDADGNFVVTLPKKNFRIRQLGESRDIAIRRFIGLEKRFQLNPDLLQPYKEFINEYLRLEHIKVVSSEGEPSQVYYLPHHAVFKLDSSTTKLRVVFDASCKTTSGISLNDALMVGPVVQQDLLSITIRFRFRRLAIVADVEKMYRMVKVQPNDQHLQRILWRDSPDETLRTYELTTVTYGTASAPYLVTKCLQTLAKENEANNPRAARVLKDDF